MLEKARTALAFVTLFFALGMHMPYFPVWLKAQGYADPKVGMVLGAITWMRVVANPLMGHLSDRLGSVKVPATLLAAAAAASYGLFEITQNLWHVMAVGVVLGVTFSPLIPLTDSVALRVGSRGAINYGHLRLFGSVAFIAAANVGGWILEHGTEDDIIDTLQGVLMVAVVALALMPRRGPAPARPAPRPRRSHHHHTVFFSTAGALHGSHALLYAFGTAHWRAVGVEDATIGQLWSVGVLAEIALFAVGGRVQRRLGSAGLLGLAALGGLLRWPLLAAVTAAPALFAIQLLHAATFAAMHLGAIAYVQERVDPSATATVTALYSAAAGLGTGMMMLAAGWLYTGLGGSAYIVMAVLSAAGLGGAWVLRRRQATP